MQGTSWVRRAPPAQAPQFIENFRRGSASALSVLFILEWATGDITNLVGAVRTCTCTPRLPLVPPLPLSRLHPHRCLGVVVVVGDGFLVFLPCYLSPLTSRLSPLPSRLSPLTSQLSWCPTATAVLGAPASDPDLYCDSVCAAPLVRAEYV